MRLVLTLTALLLTTGVAMAATPNPCAPLVLWRPWVASMATLPAAGNPWDCGAQPATIGDLTPEAQESLTSCACPAAMNGMLPSGPGYACDNCLNAMGWIALAQQVPGYACYNLRPDEEGLNQPPIPYAIVEQKPGKNGLCVPEFTDWATFAKHLRLAPAVKLPLTSTPQRLLPAAHRLERPVQPFHAFPAFHAIPMAAPPPRAPASHPIHH